MNKYLLLFLSVCCSSYFLNAQIDISEARDLGVGNVVTVEGIVTNGSELSIIRYLQDETAGIAAYPGTGSAPNFPETVKRGDLIQVTGELKTFNGLLEIDPITSYTVISSDNPLPDPLVVTPNGISEDTEASLLQVNNVTFDDGGSVFSVGNFSFSNGSESSEIYVRSGHPLIGTTIPISAVNLTGISSEFNGLYQLLLRDINDIEIADDFYFTSTPRQSNLTQDGFTISWETNLASTSTVKYGLTPDNLDGEIDMGGSTTNHSVSITGLDAGEFYYVEASSNDGSTTISSTIKIYSTASNSTGTVKIYFNHGVDESYSSGSEAEALTPAALEGAIIDRINAATTSIDVSVYNTNRETIIAALTDAYNSGVQVRYITDDETANLALMNPTPPFPVIKGNPGNPLMHNKFFVFDADSVDDSWVIMGSTNMTDNNIATDYNNMVAIQDQTIAKAYTLEFQEMWGDVGPTPGIFNLKFGEDKEDNTPHLFNLNGMEVESYFSPSDNTTLAIVNAIASAEDDFQFALLTFTNNDLGDATLNAHNNGVSVRGIIDNIGDQGTEYDYLLSLGVSVTPDNQSKSTHHKYAIIDATNPSSDPQVVTGSHNWSGSAEIRNDENTLIFHDAIMANIFLQEFEARWCEAMGGGADCIVSGTEEVNEIEGFEANVFPNPAKDNTTVSFQLEDNEDVVLSLWSYDGKMIQSNIYRNVQGQQTEQINLNGLSPGLYFISFDVNGKRALKKLEVIR